MRCSSAEVIRYSLKKIDISLPFDWCQMKATSMAKWIRSIPDEDFIKKYFSEFKENKNEEGDWFPHETWDKTLVEKYIRRSDRLHNILTSSEDKTFYIVTGIQDSSGGPDIITLYNALKDVSSGDIKIVTVNFDQVLDETVQTCLFVKLDTAMGEPGWDLWKNDIENSLVKNIFK